ncbi:LEAF RUST 10 DISEASE-RESISTANCE LOCUS RECEPTOR-LIKE PROTEIN KINASE-like 1.2 isoform X8 [Tasmannia lanceolata]|uniref:LEAF RUST 10 DISEASE-RESISTANCE LOCUS RECEPTOR-LIKE PROTEIN KINASE-like 1.2 isoform X8 n=1 Tax=Tasmannia lanceolata TaxID=3420 RepID=UPI004062819D
MGWFQFNRQPLTSRLLFFPLLFFMPQTLLSQDDERYTECAPTQFNCGVLYQISYPFWVDGRSVNCSYPAYNLTCDVDTLVTKIGSETYEVNGIDYENQVLTIVARDLIGKSCPLPSDNTTLDFSLFQYSPGSLNVTLYYNCSSTIQNGNPEGFRSVTCFSSNGNYAYYTISIVPLEIANLFRNCRLSVIPMLSTAVDRIVEDSGSLVDVLAEGFNVTWNAGDLWCNECVGSGGRCGYDPTDPNAIPCFCKDGPHLGWCYGPELAAGTHKSEETKGIIIGKLRDGRSVAVKRLYENNYKRVEQFMNEVEILSRVRHHNLVSLYGCTSRHSRELLLVYEFVPNGTVADHLHGERAQSGPLTWPIRMSIAIETAGALAYLHAVEPQIIHRDVKTNNILLDNNFQVKVADFGLSRLFPTDVTHVSTAPQGTPGYVDPDYHHCYQLTDKSDVYSFGVVLVELISSKPAVDITRNRHEINLAKMAINKIHNHALHEFVDMGLGFETDYGVRRMITLVAELAFRCLQEDREVRPSMEEVLEVLRGIESDDFPAKKAEDIDVPSDDVGLLNGIPPASPDTVMDTWASRTTTPNTSG